MQTEGRRDDEVSIDTEQETLPAHLLASLAAVRHSLMRNRDRKIAAADRIKKLQIQNVHEIYSYERDEAEAVFEVCITLSIADTTGTILTHDPTLYTTPSSCKPRHHTRKQSDCSWTTIELVKPACWTCPLLRLQYLPQPVES